ncbi:sugar phosphate isomerase/epimerase [Acidobacteria bacterium AH-259-A15]|nr:sugar phosphate isomerase/epimerase [Acidobacteria bacterium AH-259-A15]
MLNRREFLAAGLGAIAAKAVKHRTFRIAHSGSMWQDDVQEGIRACARYGFDGIEPFRNHILKYLDKPQALKEQLDAAGIALATCSNGGPMSVNFIDPTKVPQTIEDHARFARDFIAHFGCTHFKLNLGRRPDPAPTDEQLKTMARALNELGKRTAEVGLRLAPHPHIWSPFERQHEVERILELTDPQFVYLTTDTAHLTLGGIDPVKFIRKHYRRVAALHWKDTPAKYRGHRGPTASQEEHRRVNLYKNLGTGGVDFPAVLKILQERNFDGWVTLDFGQPRPGEGTIDKNVRANIKYLREVLHIKLKEKT